MKYFLARGAFASIHSMILKLGKHTQDRVSPRDIPVYLTNCLQFFPKSDNISLFHNLSKLMRRDVSVMPPSYWRGCWGTKLWKDLITSIQELINKERNPFSNSWACIPCNWQREGKEVYKRFLKISLEPVFSFSELTSSSARSKRCPKCY